MIVRGLLGKAVVCSILLSCAGCASRFKILRGSGLPNPPEKRLKLAIITLEDLTGLYPKLRVRFEDEVRRSLSKEDVKLIRNIRNLGYENPDYRTIPNIYEPVLMSTNSAAAAESTSADLILDGSIQEIFFGDAKFDATYYHFFGLMGAALGEGTKVARVSVRMRVTRAAGREILFERNIDGSVSGKDIERASSLDKAMRRASMVGVSFLLED